MIFESIGENKILAESTGQYTPPTLSISGFIRSFSGYTYHHSDPSGTFMSIAPGGSYTITFWYSKNTTTQPTATSATDILKNEGASALLQTVANKNVKPDLPSLPAATEVALADNTTSLKKPKVKTVSFDSGGMPSNDGIAFVKS